MNPWIARAVVLAATAAMIAIRTPHIRRSTKIKVVKDKKGPLETTLLALAAPGFLLPFVWVATPLLSFADYPQSVIQLVTGIICLGLGLYLLHRSHKDLGINWSNTLEVREQHKLVTNGIYNRIRHPMYLALLLYSLGQALVLPNWLAGPMYGFGFALLFALRLGREEKMMQDEFGNDYTLYAQRTKRLIPGVW